MTFTRRIAALGAALSLASAAAQAQNINFTTEGAFSGTGCSMMDVQATFASCTAVGGVKLTYMFGAQQVLNGFGNAQFGTFTTIGTGPSAFNDVLFSLTVKQTSPTVGSSVSSASVFGNVSAIQGGLIWAPITPATFMIDNVHYTLSRDVVSGGVLIDPPGVGGSISSQQTIRGLVSTVPEPSTFGLVAAGMGALVFVSRRRRTD